MWDLIIIVATHLLKLKLFNSLAALVILNYKYLCSILIKLLTISFSSTRSRIFFLCLTFCKSGFVIHYTGKKITFRAKSKWQNFYINKAQLQEQEQILQRLTIAVFDQFLTKNYQQFGLHILNSYAFQCKLPQSTQIEHWTINRMGHGLAIPGKIFKYYTCIQWDHLTRNH